jgi:CBS-domain-containing membrane protein
LIVKKAEHLKHLENSGYSVPRNNLSDILSAIPVKALLKKDFILLKANSSLQEIVNEYVENGNKSILMVNENMNVIGIVTDAELRPILTDYESVKDFFVGADVMNTNFSILKPNDNLEHALQVFAKYEFDELPVVDNSSNKIIGVLNKQDLIKSYNQETIKKNLAGNIATEIKTISKTKWSAVTDSHSIVEIKIPKQFVGKSLGELSFRNVYNIEVLLIKQEQNIDSNNSNKENILFPSVDYHFLESDRILLFGENEKLEQTREW